MPNHLCKRGLTEFLYSVHLPCIDRYSFFKSKMLVIAVHFVVLKASGRTRAPSACVRSVRQKSDRENLSKTQKCSLCLNKGFNKPLSAVAEILFEKCVPDEVLNWLSRN